MSTILDALRLGRGGSRPASSARDSNSGGLPSGAAGDGRGPRLIAVVGVVIAGIGAGALAARFIVGTEQDLPETVASRPAVALSEKPDRAKMRPAGGAVGAQLGKVEPPRSKTGGSQAAAKPEATEPASAAVAKPEAAEPASAAAAKPTTAKPASAAAAKPEATEPASAAVAKPKTAKPAPSVEYREEAIKEAMRRQARPPESKAALPDLGALKAATPHGQQARAGAWMSPQSGAKIQLLQEPPADAPHVDILFIQWAREPAERMASVRLQGGTLSVVHEGNVVAGMAVAMIRPQSIVFTWRGKSFWLPVHRF